MSRYSTTQAAFVNSKALQRLEQELKAEKFFGWMRKGHHHRLVILQAQLDMVQTRQERLGEGAKRREAA